MRPGYFWRLAIAVDQLVNVALCNGDPDETMSSAAWRMEQEGRFWGFMRKVIDLLASPWERDHCRGAYISEVTRSQLTDELAKPKRKRRK